MSITRDLTQSWFFWFCIAMIVCAVLCGCGSVAVEGGGDGNIGAAPGAGNDKVVYNSWIPYVIIILSMIVIFIGYLWFSKRFTRFGRGCSH